METSRERAQEQGMLYSWALEEANVRRRYFYKKMTSTDVTEGYIRMVLYNEDTYGGHSHRTTEGERLYGMPVAWCKPNDY